MYRYMAAAKADIRMRMTPLCRQCLVQILVELALRHHTLQLDAGVVVAGNGGAVI